MLTARAAGVVLQNVSEVDTYKSQWLQTHFQQVRAVILQWQWQEYCNSSLLVTQFLSCSVQVAEPTAVIQSPGNAYRVVCCALLCSLRRSGGVEGNCSSCHE